MEVGLSVVPGGPFAFVLGVQKLPVAALSFLYIIYKGRRGDRTRKKNKNYG